MCSLMLPHRVFIAKAPAAERTGETLDLQVVHFDVGVQVVARAEDLVAGLVRASAIHG